MRFITAILRRRRRRAGFSLLDVLIGMVVLVIAIGFSLELAGRNAQEMLSNQQVAGASLLAQNKMEELRNSTYANIATGSDTGTLDAQGNSGGIYSRSWTVTADTPMVGMKSIDVTVTWSQWNKTQSYVMHGEVAQ